MRWFLALALLLVPLLCCSRDRHDRPGETVTTTGATLELVPAGIAHDRVVAAQCMREQLCVEVGLATEVPSDCSDRVRGTRCRGSVDSRALEECVQAIYNASCSLELEARGTLDPCRESALCRAPQD